MNPPELLKELRGHYRVPQSKFAKHPVIRKLKKHVGRPVYHYDTPCPSFVVNHGDAVGDAFYQDGVFYMGPNDSRDRNSILHEYCHALVAMPQGKMDRDNFDSSTSEENLTCRVQLYLGVATGYYTYEQLLAVMDEYAITQELETNPKQHSSPEVCENYLVESVYQLLLEMREEVLEIPNVKELVGDSGVDRLDAFFEGPRRKYT